MAMHYNCEVCGKFIREDTAHAVCCPMEELEVANEALEPKSQETTDPGCD